MIRCAFFINLDRDADRRAATEATLRAAGLLFERFPALTPATCPPELLARFRRPGDLMPGEIGCFASHLAVLERVAASPDGYYAVFEDDVELTGDFAALGRALASCPRPPEVLRLENLPKTASVRIWRAEGFDFLRPLHIPNSSAGYLATPAGARRILDFAWEADMAYDRFLREIGRADVEMLVCAPPPLRLLDAPSSVDPGGGRAGRPRRYSFRGSGFSLGGLARFVRRFGAVTLARVLLANLALHLSRERRPLDFVVTPWMRGR